MKEIPLTNGGVALVDDDDYATLSQYTWCRHPEGYAMRHIEHSAERRMHRVIMQPNDPEHVDHIDHNGLNNQRSNLRICTPSQNQANSRKLKAKSSIYKGVCLYKRDGTWKASICVNHKSIHVGYYVSEVEAAKAYDAAARMYFGEFAYCNFGVES